MTETRSHCFNNSHHPILQDLKSSEKQKLALLRIRHYLTFSSPWSGILQNVQLGFTSFINRKKVHKQTKTVPWEHGQVWQHYILWQSLIKLYIKQMTMMYRLCNTVQLCIWHQHTAIWQIPVYLSIILDRKRVYLTSYIPMAPSKLLMAAPTAVSSCMTFTPLSSVWKQTENSWYINCNLDFQL